ncbi:hypothetical protein D8M04_09955 [Oceanobacillus piezotolerans]|uniref:Uncharacterized protein n=1 Tax=Oceanobacillus piezotolerans TaxID=2448030 RepID=A0A498DDW6_9BACI|nr:hypothetical protein [Oceanobacillus piezotolerans]RLL45174.1 hypothetical protein D8M04_09955 [Oceanobacillus piezotolerans]
MNAFYFIKLSQLSALGIEENDIHLFLIIVGVILSFLLIKPIVEWFVVSQSTKVLSYLISSLFILVLFFTMVLSLDAIEPLTFSLLNMLLKVLAVFGAGLLLLRVVEFFSELRKGRN